jgi:hypothetical protein
MIFDREPGDWNELQTMVAQAFIETGFDAQVSVEVPLVRGKKEIDVLVREVINKITTLVFVECKYWNSAVPQEIVHGFRTVVADGGAHKGYIIAKTGFQSGAHEVRDKTNVEILTWEQFNKLYFSRWQKVADEKLARRAKRMIDFRDSPYGPKEEDRTYRLTETQRLSWIDIFRAGESFAGLGLGKILFKLDQGPYEVVYPEPDPSRVEFEDMFWKIKSHREFYDYMDPKFDEFMRRIDEWKAEYEQS